MTILAQEAELQEELTFVYELLLQKTDALREELNASRLNYERACDKHICSGFANEKEWNNADSQHRLKFIEYDIYCHIVEIVNDYMDIYGQFPEYKEMHATLHEWMLQFANAENYELAAILKAWVDKIEGIIRLKINN